MVRITEIATVHQAPDRVFRAAADPHLQLEWDPGTLRSVEKLTSEPLGKGSRYRGEFKGFGTVDYEFVEFDEPHRFAHRARIKMGEMTHTFAFAPVPEGTRMTQVGELAHPTLLGRLMAPVMRRMLAKRFRLIALELEEWLRAKGPVGAS
jgi:uncharacterized protein YndB with AHSA1/START domain